MIGKNIQQLRKRTGMTQETLAEKLGVSRQTIAKWEAGESVPDLSNSSKLAEVFQVRLDDLVNEEEDPASGRTIEPIGKYRFGVVQVDEKGRIPLPEDACEIFGITPGSYLFLFGDITQGLALLPEHFFSGPLAEILRVKTEQS